jgi:prepilin-type N-terminal cleavage/methylation domain-containing protein
MSKKRSSGGFTLLELLLALLVLGVLAAVGLPAYERMRDSARDAALKTGVHEIQVAVVTFAADNGGNLPALAAVDGGGAVAQTMSSWPTNPWTGRPMANSERYSRGDFNYSAWAAVADLNGYAAYNHYSLVGWTSQAGHPFVATAQASGE